ncbi:hypothetical protein [Microbacterium trichothecenolyticum]|uniref:Secreted protein n=1 Tax=Microbacterium trichothecenolyticum TaxID=69370 RepID=A0ABU0TW70_MICTR|nr:hypothetical protein [Microbacterium trichothecenolyticum]MDQ1123907.1 hypothetical protein [Microbacterium trichothecenolyticum]
MSTPPFAARLARRLAVVGTAAAMSIAAVSVPQMASARVVTNPGYTVCVSSSVKNLVASGSVVRERGVQGLGYYTVGGHDYLGTDKRATQSIAQRSPGVWFLVPLCA